MISSWHGEAFNQVPNSQNEIHGDKVAQDYGFKGGLVPGVTVSAYLLHPAAEAFGMDFLSRGHAHVRVTSPLYDKEPFEVQVQDARPDGYSAVLVRPDGTASASARVDIPARTEEPPVRRGDPIGDKQETLAPATTENMRALQNHGCRALVYRWEAEHEMSTYLRDRELMAAPYREGYANPSFILGLSNWLLAGNAYMNPWVHMKTESRFYAPIAAGTKLVGEMSIANLFEKKGHEFVDAVINVYDFNDDRCYATINLRAIYRLRGMD